MPRQMEDYGEDRHDVIEELINTSEMKLSQLTDVPDGCIQGFSGMETIARIGESEELPQDIFRREFYKLRRSKNGMMLLGILKLALEKTASEGMPDSGSSFMAD